MQIPIMSGLEVLDLIKQMSGWSETPFIIFSAPSFTVYIRNGLTKAAQAFYSKPNTFQENQRVIIEMVQHCQ